jgi:hypothetical protein
MQDGQADCELLNVEAVDEGGGHFLVLKTEGWSIDPDEIDMLADMLRDALAGLGHPPNRRDAAGRLE